ncbi:hypothetical protein ACIRPK_22465 [Kitasatospora sp. NPDC101801]|uniref:DUF3885 domain-containing protein n=1 Tax=Kitasatospora sp. NPDC101801 TaxID=3364103 RepID=UPI00382BC9FA
MRFHYLPGSKRYPDSEAEYRLLLGRQHTVLRDLGAPAELVVITCAWNGDDGTEPVERTPELKAVAPGAYWRTIIEDERADPADQVATHLYVGHLANAPQALDPLLRAIADEVTIGVILAPEGLDWLVHPYDGGIDIITATSAERDRLKDRHPDWLSPHPRGY